jgi:glutathione S-transferase
MSQLTLYTNPMSRGRIIRWMLEEIGVSYETKLLDYGTTMKSPEYLAINSMGKVPALVHNGAVVTETAAICAYLADAFPEAGLLPQTVAEKAAYFRWLFFAAAPLEQAISLKTAEVVVTEELQKLFGCGHPDQTFANLSNALKANKYIAGERFTAADIYIGSHIGFGLQFGHLPPLPEFVAYCERVCNRPAKLKADQIDDALLAQHPIN